MIALSCRQPWAGLVVCGAKTEEYRPRATRVRGRVLIYACKGGPPVAHLGGLVLHDGMYHAIDLRRGLLLGSVELWDCRRLADGWAWLLRNARPLARAVRPRRCPQPAFFRPF